MIPFGRILFSFISLTFSLDAFDHFAAVLSPKHHDDSADRLVLSVDHGGALPHGFADLYFGDIFHIRRRACVGFQNDILNVGRILYQSDPSNDVLIRVFFDDISAGILIVLFDRGVYLVDRNAMFQEPVGRDDYLILFEIPAERIYFVHSRNAFQQAG